LHYFKVKSFHYWLLGVIIALLGGAILLVASFFYTVGHDDTQKQSIGIITKHGMPFPFAFSAPGNTWTNFSGYAALADYSIYSVLILVLFHVFSKNK
jgi:hypothetical protein